MWYGNFFSHSHFINFNANSQIVKIIIQNSIYRLIAFMETDGHTFSVVYKFIAHIIGVFNIWQTVSE